MTLVEGQIYTYTFPASVPASADIGIVFNKGIEGPGEQKTDDLVFNATSNCYNNGSWMTLEACQDDTVVVPTGQRSVYVHLFEWSWNDIAEECEQFLGPKGYAAVQVSPPQEHALGDQWWTRYQPVSFNIKQSRSGTRAEFIDMVERCAAVDVDIYVDAVINHMAARASGTGSAGTPYNPNTLDYPNLSSADFHDNCGISPSDYGNDAHRVRTCRLVGLPDLRTGSEYVRDLLADYMNDLIAIGVKGFRIDAAKHMAVADIAAIINRLDEEVYIFQEVIDLGSEAVSASEYVGISDVTEFLYSARIGEVFKHGQLASLKNFGEAWSFMAGQHAVVFTDNHDNQRGHGAGGANVLTYKDSSLYDLANVFMLAWPYGYPQVMSSYAFTDTEAGPPSSPVHGGSLNCFGSDWKCEHRWRPIANMVQFRNHTLSQPVTNWWGEGNQIAFGRGDRGFVIINRSGSQLTRTFQTSMEPGEYCNVIAADFEAGSCSTTVTVGGSGQISVDLGGMSAIAIHVGAKL